MGLLLIGLVAGMLIGYGMPPSTQASLQMCGSKICFDGSVPPQAEPKASAPTPDTAAKATKAATSAKPEKRSPPRRDTRVPRGKNPPPKAMEDRAAAAGTSEAVLSKAKMSVAAKMEDPASAEFTDAKRAIRKNTLGRSVDTICGHVRGKKASGEDTGEKPFLYLVKEDDVYVVDGKANSAAAIAYRNICN
ncbi:hypothetical protein [Bradyrhizobium sp. Leo121]|uniref:hypothetical protein n=1 Tax=Bradyrhizobium sp. Leo121 TaxID=1571195 RepID=UPI001FDFEA6A|nr:hypothetical protein [Bradyrhizobium sp. Leo121]